MEKKFIETKRNEKKFTQFISFKCNYKFLKKIFFETL